MASTSIIVTRSPSPPPSAANVGTLRGPASSEAKALSPGKLDDLSCVITSFENALPPGVAKVNDPPPRKDTPGILHWLSGIFDSIRRYIRREAAVGTYPQTAVAQATARIDEAQAAVSDCVRQHAAVSDRHFGQRIASLFADLASWLRHWFNGASSASQTRGAARDGSDTVQVLNAQDVARWKAGKIDRDDMFGLARDAQRLRAALQRVPGIENLRDDQGNTLAHLLGGCGAFLAPDDAKAVCNVLAAAPGLDLSITNARGETPLHIAVACASDPVNTHAVLPALIERAAEDGFDFHRHDDSGLTVLQRAVMDASPDAIDLLLAQHGKGVDVGLDVLSRSGGTALCHALSVYRLDIAQKLLDAGASARPGQIDNLAPAVWLRRMMDVTGWQQWQLRIAGDKDGELAAAEFAKEGKALLSRLDAMSRRDIPAYALK